MSILESFFKNFIAKISCFLIIILPFILLVVGRINLFENGAYMSVFILSVVLLSLTSLTDFSIELPGFKSSVKNTGASIEINEDQQNKNYKIITHGVADENKAKSLVREMRKKP